LIVSTSDKDSPLPKVGLFEADSKRDSRFADAEIERIFKDSQMIATNAKNSTTAAATHANTGALIPMNSFDLRK
jgi:hypothetical protein